MKLRYIYNLIAFACLLFPISAFSQNLKVGNFEESYRAAFEDGFEEVKDLNGCLTVPIIITSKVPDLQFEGNVIKVNTVSLNNVLKYYVYATIGSKILNIKSPLHASIKLNITDNYPEGFQSDKIYRMDILEVINNDYISYLQNKSDSGDSDATNKLGVLYATGKGVQIDLQRAISLYLQAANAGNKYALYNLGVCL